MTETQKRIYYNLISLVESNDAFFFKDHIVDDVQYRIFSYRLASYTDFLLDDAIECRGIMYELEDNHPIRLAAFPMSKFWNINENPSTMNLDFSAIQEASLKMDGSLISTYLHNNELRLKSKASLSSDHAINAMKYLDLHENLKFKSELTSIENSGFTINMEYTSPEQSMRIVIGYSEPKLTILNIRDRYTGKYLTKDDIDEEYSEILNHWVELITVQEGQKFVDSIRDMIGIEGYVIKLNSGLWVKQKTSWYQKLHFTKDSVNNPRRLFNVVLEDASDDLKSMFYDDPFALKLIEDMELLCEKLYNTLVKNVENFYENHKMLKRKDYAILGQKALDTREFSLAMLKYQNKKFSYKTKMQDWYKEFGIKDCVLEKLDNNVE